MLAAVLWCTQPAKCHVTISVLVTVLELRRRRIRRKKERKKERKKGIIVMVAALNEDKVDFKYMLVLPKNLFTADSTAFSQCRVPPFKTFCKYGAWGKVSLQRIQWACYFVVNHLTAYTPYSSRQFVIKMNVPEICVWMKVIYIVRWTVVA